MDCIGETIEFLKSYEHLQKALNNILLDIKELQEELNSGQLGAIEYSDMPKGDSSTLPGDDVINKMYSMQVKKKQYIETKKKLDKINKIISELPAQDQKVLKFWYMEGLRGDTALKHIGCTSERQLHRDKNRAIRTLAIQLHGIMALKCWH